VKNKKILVFFSKHWQIILASTAFLAYQLYINFTIWDRTGNIPPGFGDSLGYIFGIEKVAKYHNLFPQIPYFGNYKLQPAHFSYFGYNLIFGFLGIILNTSGYNIFFYSFIFGKLVLLISCILLLKSLLPDSKTVVAFVLLSLGLFVGDGSIHGFFWVVPSFWMLVLFFLLITIINSPQKIKIFPVFLLCLLYITVHPLSIFSIFIFTTYNIFLFIFTKKIHKKAITVTAILVISAILWQICILGIPSLNKNNNTPATPPKTVIQTIKEINNASNKAQTNSVLYITKNIKKDDVVQQISNSAPSLPQVKIFDELLKKNSETTTIQKTSFIAAWNSYFSWFFRLPFLLIILFGGVYLSAKKKRWDLLSLYLSCLSFTLISMINPMGHRSILFLFPVTIIFITTTLYDLIVLLRKSSFKFSKLVLYILYLTIPIALIGYAVFGIVTVKYYSTIADYKINPSKCIEYIKKFEPEKTKIFFTSVEGINYFLNQDIEKYYITGINNFEKIRKETTTLLISENYEKINKSDIDMPLVDNSNVLSKIKNNIQNITNIDCDIFHLFDISNTLTNPN